MATSTFKEGITERFKMLVSLLIRRGLAKNNTDVGLLMDQPPQAVSKMLMGDRIITLEQITKLSQRTDLNANWLLIGEGEVFGQLKQESADVISSLTKAVNAGQLSVTLGEDAITTITELRNKLLEKQEEVNDLKSKTIDLLTLIKNS